MTQIFGILNRYISKIILNGITIALFILASLSIIIKFFDQIKKTGQGNYDAIGAGIYTVLSIPKDIQCFFPMAVLIGTLLGLGILAQRNELIIMQASGFTRTQIILSVIKTVTSLVFLVMSVNEWIIPKTEQIARNYRMKAMYGDTLLSIQKKLWIKDSNSFIYIERIKRNHELIGITIYTFDQKHRLQFIRYAASAKFDLDKKLWILSQVNEYNLQDSERINTLQTSSATWQTDLTPGKLDIITLNPDTLSISMLYNYVQYLKSSGQDAWRYQFSMWGKIFQPISISAVVLMILSLVFRVLHSMSIETVVVIGVIFGFIFHMFDQIFGLLALIYRIPPITSALFPSISFFLISLKLLSKYS